MAAAQIAGVWLSAPAVAQPIDNNGAAAIACLWGRLNDAAQSSVTGSVWRYMDENTGEIAPGVAVRLMRGSCELDAAVTPDALAACCAPQDPAARRMAVLGVAAREPADQARGRILALGGEPYAIDVAFAPMPSFWREELADWVWAQGDDPVSDQALSGFWRAIERIRVNRAFQQERQTAFGLVARLAEHRAARCLTEAEAGLDRLPRRADGSPA